MTIPELKVLVEKNSEDKSEEFIRLFHGRGGCYDGLEALTIDSINRVLYVALFAPFNSEIELKEMLTEIYESKKWDAIIIQRRFEKDTPTEVFLGELPLNSVAIENGIQFKLNHLANQNNGFFPDMKVGRSFVKEMAKGKNVLNLFSYTCGFSLAALSGGAKKVVNVDMSKSVLSTGRENHRINKLDTNLVSFMPYNILKSWSRIKKAGPYDLIIIDPPSFQKGSFEATKDYAKIIKRMEELACKECIVLSCLNSPDLDENFVKDIFIDLAPDFIFDRRLDNLDSFPASNEKKSLKNLVFKRKM